MDPGAPPPPPPPGDDPYRQLLEPGFVERATMRELSAEERSRAHRERSAARAAHPASAGPPGGRRRRRSSGRLARWGGAVAVLTVVVAAVLGVGLSSGGDLFSPSPSPGSTAAPATPVKRRPDSWPSRPAASAAEPLGTPPTVTTGGPHAFAALQDDGVTPVAWDPCRPVRYVIRPGGPPGADVLLRQAIDRVSAATGLRFVDEGTTDEAPSEERDPYQPDRYGDRWAPVLVAWSDATESPRLGQTSPSEAGTADVAGIGGASSAGWEGEPSIYVSGSLVLDEPDLTRMLSEPGGPDLVRAVVMHELGHVVGLDHVEDPTQLMNPRTEPGVVDFGAGDLEGLAALGSGSCVPDV